MLDRVDFEVQRGEMHALLGGNGAGKSTLMKILSGRLQLDAGAILVDGQPTQLASARRRRASGIATVFQEFSLIPSLTVAQNIYLTREARTRWGSWTTAPASAAPVLFWPRWASMCDPQALVSDAEHGPPAGHRDRQGAVPGRRHPHPR